MKRKTVTQEHGTGCAVACVAFVLNLPYQKALKYFARAERAWGGGFFCRDVTQALERRGPKYTHRYVGRKKEHLWRPGTIVYVAASKKYPLGHYLVRTAEGDWMNPWANFPLIASA